MCSRIVLFGKPTAGKTTIGQLIASIFELEFTEGSSVLRPFNSRKEAREKHEQLKKIYGDGATAKFFAEKKNIILTGRGLDNAIQYKKNGFFVIFLDTCHGRSDIDQDDIDEEEKIYHTSQIKEIADLVVEKNDLETTVRIIMQAIVQINN